MTGYRVGEPHPRSELHDDLPLDVVVCAVTAGCTPRAVETAYAERSYRRADPVVMLSAEAGVELCIIEALRDRWGINTETRT